MHRLRSGLSQGEVARLLGSMSGSKVSRYERSERCPSLETLLAYEILFGNCGRVFFEGLCTKLEEEIRDRAKTLYRQLDQSRSFDAITKRKMDFLAEVIYPPIYEKE